MNWSRIWDRSGLTSPFSPQSASKHVIAFFVPGSDRCDLHAVVWDNPGSDTDKSATGVRISLVPGQIAHIDSAESASLNLQCSSSAATIAIISTDELVACGITIRRFGQPLKANASGFLPRN